MSGAAGIGRERTFDVGPGSGVRYALRVLQCTSLLFTLNRLTRSRFGDTFSAKYQGPSRAAGGGLVDRLPVRGAFVAFLCVCTSVPALYWGQYRP